MLALTSRVAVLVLAGAMALRQMGLADSIINLAFGLVLGAIAVAAAIAFGIGGREVARQQLEKFVVSTGIGASASTHTARKPAPAGSGNPDTPDTSTPSSS